MSKSRSTLSAHSNIRSSAKVVHSNQMFISFEGPEGGGKSTAIQVVAERLRSDGWKVLCTREPGAGKLGSEIRSLLLHGEELVPETELLLFLADRSNHVAKIIRPALDTGMIVLCDRFADSTLVYQGIARGLAREFVEAGNRFAVQGLIPELTLLLDLPSEIGLSRIVNKDRMDSQPLDFHHQVRSGFLELARNDPTRWRILDASQAPAQVHSEILREIALVIRSDALS